VRESPSATRAGQPGAVDYILGTLEEGGFRTEVSEKREGECAGGLGGAKK